MTMALNLLRSNCSRFLRPVFVIVLIFNHSSLSLATPDSSSVAVDVLVVGAGAAGLEAGNILRANGLSHLVVESQNRAGGRLRSRSDALGLGLTIDDGANLVNSDDGFLLRLMGLFGIEKRRRLTRIADSMTYVINGNYLSQDAANRLLFSTAGSIMKRIAVDGAVIPQNGKKLVDQGQDEVAEKLKARLSNVTISQYISGYEGSPVFAQFLEGFFMSEYGVGIDALNALVLLDYFNVDLKNKLFKFIPHVDEAYTLPKGTSQITDQLAELDRENIRFGETVNAITGPDENGLMTVRTRLADRENVYHARHVHFTAPLPALNDMDIKVQGISPEVLREAGEAGYGRGGKIHLIFRPAFEKIYTHNEIVLTSNGAQIWRSSLGQNGYGLFTSLIGGIPEGAALEAKVAELKSAMQTVLNAGYEEKSKAPRIDDYFIGYDISVAPLTYSGALTVGQVFDLKVAALKLSYMSFAGEAFGGAKQGYLEGAIASVYRPLRKIIRQLRGPTYKYRVFEEDLLKSKPTAHPSCKDLFI